MAKRGLRVLLCISGLVQLLAIAPVFFPFAWMAAIHDWMDIGDLPDLPITAYLTRSLSMLYAAWGALYLLLAADVDRYLPLIRFLAWLKLLLAAGLLVLDYVAGMPWYWTGSEGPSLLVLYGLLIWLARRRACELATTAAPAVTPRSVS